MLRRTPLSCSGWPLACTPGGCVRIGLAGGGHRRALRVRGAACPATCCVTRAAGGRGAGFRRAIGRGALDVVHRDHAIGAGRAHAREVDAELARQRAHRRHRLDAADRDRGFAAHRIGATASRRPRCRRRRACRPASPFGAGVPASLIAPPSSDATTWWRRRCRCSAPPCACARLRRRGDGRCPGLRRAAASTDRSRTRPASCR